MVTDKKPWLTLPQVWKTESSFWAWVRGVLRNGWKKHPIKLEYIKRFRKRIQNPKVESRKRFPEVWGMTCSVCQQDTAQSEIEIDHISETGGKFTCLDDIKSYAAHLFLVDFDSLRPVCKSCHKIINQSQKKGISFDEAKIQKQAIALIDSMETKQLLAYLQQKGYNSKDTSNATKRRSAVEELFRKGEIDVQTS